MTYAEAKEILGEQKWRLENTPGFEAWLDTTEHFINDIFGLSSAQANNLRKLKRDFNISKITARENPTLNENNYRSKAYGQITGLIQYLTEKEKLDVQKQEHERKEKASVLKMKENANAFPPMKISWFKRIGNQFASLKIQAWGIIIAASIACMSLLYKIGYDFASSKYDRDKNELYQKNQALENKLKGKDDTIKVKSDSIKLMRMKS